ncbi:MAG: sugar transferase [Armatimonadota bacterium]|nr:sugar transferase [Armatimonadota bacterium]
MPESYSSSVTPTGVRAATPQARIAGARTLALRLSERKIILFLADMAAIVAALLLVLHLRFGAPLSWTTVARDRGWFLLLGGLWVVFAFLLDTYDLQRASRIASGVSTAGATALATTAAYLLIPYITPPLHQSRLTALLFVGAMLGLVAVGRTAYAGLLVQPTFRHRLLIVGAGQAGRTLVDVIRAHAGVEYTAVGFVDDAVGHQPAAVQGLPVLGTSHDLVRVAEQHGVSEVVLAITQRDRLSPALVQALIDCRERGMHVSEMQVVCERLTGRVPLAHAGTNLHVVLPVGHGSHRIYAVVKRLTDLVIGLVGLATLVLVLPAVALLIRLDGPGPIFYRQVRIGRGGRPFVLTKFRTMRVDAEDDGPQWAQPDDPRVTRIGRWLRRLHVDELPQALNLLRGEMSCVGPRPERPEFVAELDRHIPFYRARHAVRPGVTGWAQVNYPYGRSLEDALVKLEYDLYYVKHCSPLLDATILLRTLAVVLSLRER